MYIALVGAVIHNNHLLLIKKIKHGNTYYVLPGGHWDFPETWKEGCKREVKEETNIDVIPQKKLMTYHEKQKGRFNIIYLCRTKDGKFGDLKVNGKEKGYKDLQEFKPEWIPFEELSSLPIIFDDVKCIIHMILNKEII